METGTCGLCKKSTKLCESDIIPKLVYRWLKNTGSDYFRSVINPNQRQQGGEKRPFLCLECEQLFSACETKFQQGLWQQAIGSPRKIYTYTEKDIYCILSIVWRCTKMESDRKNIPEEWQSFVTTWEPYLLEKGILPEVRINIVVGSAVKEVIVDNYVNNTVLYIERGIDATPVHRVRDHRLMGYYLKMGPLFVWVTYDIAFEDGLENTLLHVSGGTLTQPQTIRGIVGDFIKSRIDGHANASKLITDNQKKKITQHFLSRKEEIIPNSGLGKTLIRESIARRACKNQSTKVGRNDPCPCGSGNKYKRCCLNNSSLVYS